jgi:hypothetical protein
LGLIAWVDPKTAGPSVSESAAKAEAQRQAAYMYNARLKEFQRVQDIAFKLEAANQDLCADRAARLGIFWSSAADVDRRFHDAAVEALHLSDQPSVLYVVADGPAAAAGVQRGDVLVSINGEATPTGKQSVDKVDKRLKEILAKSPDAPVTFVVRRDGQAQTLSVNPVKTCAYDVAVEDSSEMNAFADGKKVHINRPILKLVDSDEELALVIAHEIAHNGQHHIQAQQKNRTLAGLGGLLLDGVAAAYGVDTGGAFTKTGVRIGAEHALVAFESEADYVGMYYLARAGYSTAGVENLWRKFAAEAPDAIFVKTDHPVTPQRFLAIAATSQEIEAKRAKGEPLVPNQVQKSP